MRNKVRFQPYIPRALHQKVRSFAAANDVTESAVTEAALAEYCEGDRTDRDWLIRRLDLIARNQSGAEAQLAQARSDIDALSDAIGILVRYAFLPAITEAGPDQDERVEARYQVFLRRARNPGRGSGWFGRQVRGEESSMPGHPGRPPQGGR
jgi:hypothetical protein